MTTPIIIVKAKSLMTGPPKINRARTVTNVVPDVIIVLLRV